MDADPHDRRPSWLLLTVPAGHEAVSVKLTTLWITAVSPAGLRTPDALNCGIETTRPETGALTGALTRRWPVLEGDSGEAGSMSSSRPLKVPPNCSHRHV